MENKKKSIGIFIIASAILWGIVILGCSFKLKGTECFKEIIYILSLGASFHLLFIWSPLAIIFKKMKKE